MPRYGILWLKLIVCGAIAFPLIKKGSELMAVGDARGMVLMFTGVFLLAIPLASLLSEVAGSIFLPEERFRRPPPMYGIPESKVQAGAFEEAMSGFEAIAEKYPKELKPWLEMIDIAAVHLKDLSRTQQIYGRAMVAMPKEEDREVLARCYRAATSRIDPDPEWLQQNMARQISLDGVETGDPGIPDYFVPKIQAGEGQDDRTT